MAVQEQEQLGFARKRQVICWTKNVGLVNIDKWQTGE